MIKVWHRKVPSFSADLLDVRSAWHGNEYECVATVTSLSSGWDSEEEWAFYRTNTIDTLWTDNQDVAPVRRELRSTSVGDIVETSDGRLMVVDHVGWLVLTV